MGDNPLISIIVPIYNVEDCLRECIDSLLAQTYENIEIILVDDGSPDNCGMICDDYAVKDSRIMALHKNNGGLSDARNFGLKRASGEYISFVDSDDYVSPLFIELLYEAIADTSIPIAEIPGGISFRDGDIAKLKRERTDLKVEILESHEVLKRMLYQRIATGAPWRLYRRDVLGDEPFPVGIYYEDLASTYQFIYRAGHAALIDCYDLYAYRLRDTSIIRQEFKPIKAISAVAVSRQLFRDISRWYPDLSNAAASRCFSVCRMVFAQLPRRKQSEESNKQYQVDLWSELKSHRVIVLKDGDARKRERLAAAIACLGMPAFKSFCTICKRLGLLR